jgi:DNA invertase Pin-like site-specific DNA recombinase
MLRPKVYSYLRFSSPEQAKGDSKRRQLAAAYSWAAENGMELDEELHDEGISGWRGTNLKHDAALGGFLRAVQAGAVAPGSVLVIESLDRLSRDLARKAQRLLEDICDSHVDVVTLADRKRYSKEVFDRDPMAIIWSLLVFMRGNEESETKSKRVAAAWSTKRNKAIETGKRMTPVCPGWLRPEGEGFAPIPERVAIVNRIFAETLAGRGQHAIAQTLTAEGVPTWRRGKVWHRTFVAKLLNNEAVIGTIALGSTMNEDRSKRRRIVKTVEGYYPAVIDRETWERTRALLGNRERPKGGASDKPVRFLLAGLARCPSCDATMTRVAKGPRGGRPYLICTTAKAGGLCRRQHVRAEAIDAAIFDRFVELLIHKPAANANEADYLDRLRNLEGAEQATIEELQDLHEARRARKFGAAQREREDVLYGYLREMEAERAAIEKEWANTASPIVEARLSRLVEALEIGPQPDLRQPNAALRENFAAVTVNYRDGTWGFRWRHGGESWLTYDYRWAIEEDGEEDAA